MNQWKKMKAYHESIKSWYVCSRSAKDFYLREKEAQVVGKTFINQAKQDSLDKSVDFLLVHSIFFKMIYVEHIA